MRNENIAEWKCHCINSVVHNIRKKEKPVQFVKDRGHFKGQKHEQLNKIGDLGLYNTYQMFVT